MKTKIHILLISTLLLFTASVITGNTKKCEKQDEQITAEQPIKNLQSFIAINKEGKTYLTWKVLKEESNCAYVIEKSLDGNSFSIVGLKEGYASSIPFTIMYSWIDQKQIVCNYCVRYRIKRINDKGEIAYSNTIEILATEIEEPLL